MASVDEGYIGALKELAIKPDDEMDLAEDEKLGSIKLHGVLASLLRGLSFAGDQGC